MAYSGDESDIIENRKREHLEASLKPGMRGAGCGLADLVRLPYDALFEVCDSGLDTGVVIAGRRLEFPLLFGAITGGTREAGPFNTALRGIAAEHGLGMCLGSIRAALCDKSLIWTYGSGDVPLLMGNIGANEVASGVYGVSQVADMCGALGCCALMIHLNGLQEFVQGESGGIGFCGAYDKIREFVEGFPMPVFVKEVGSGIGGASAGRIAALGVSGIETAGLGGTSWVRVELSRRSGWVPEFAHDLDTIGYNMADSIRAIRPILGDGRALIASGGISGPADNVRAIALGADAVAVAGPLFGYYRDGGVARLSQAVDWWVKLGRLIWRSTGARNAAELRASAHVVGCAGRH